MKHLYTLIVAILVNLPCLADDFQRPEPAEKAAGSRTTAASTEPAVATDEARRATVDVGSTVEENATDKARTPAVAEDAGDAYEVELMKVVVLKNVPAAQMARLVGGLDVFKAKVAMEPWGKDNVLRLRGTREGVNTAVAILTAVDKAAEATVASPFLDPDATNGGGRQAPAKPRPPQLAHNGKDPPETQIKIVHLKHLDAAEAVDLLKKLNLLPSDDMLVVPRGMQMIFRGEKAAFNDAFDAAVKLLEELDTPETAPGDVPPLPPQPRASPNNNVVDPSKPVQPKYTATLQIAPDGRVLLGGKSSVDALARLLAKLDSKNAAERHTAIKEHYAEAEREAARTAAQIRELDTATAGVKGKQNLFQNRKRNALELDELKAQLQQQVTVAFEVRMYLQQQQLEQAEADLKTARARLARRAKLADRIIERRIEELESGEDTSWLGRPDVSESSSLRRTSQDLSRVPPQEPSPTEIDVALLNLRIYTGLTVTGVTRPLGRYRGGLIVGTVDSDSIADEAGIRRGDVLVGLDRWETASIASLAFVLKKLNEGALPNPVKFYIVRNNETLYGTFDLSNKTQSVLDAPDSNQR